MPLQIDIMMSLIPHREPCLTFGYRCGIMGSSSVSYRGRGDKTSGWTGAHEPCPSTHREWGTCLYNQSHDTIRYAESVYVEGRLHAQPLDVRLNGTWRESKSALRRPTTRCRQPRMTRPSHASCEAGEACKPSDGSLRLQRTKFAGTSLWTYCLKPSEGSSATVWRGHHFKKFRYIGTKKGE
jgi:hypothetical protein